MGVDYRVEIHALLKPGQGIEAAKKWAAKIVEIERDRMTPNGI
jgi:hypothetical protein